MARIVGNNRNNTLRGTDDDDVILGRGGSDRLLGRGDGDRLFGESGSDSLTGGDDGDVLDGGRGNDRLTGGDDGDRFVFRFGRDVITDFRPGSDDDDDDDDDDDVIDLRDMPGIDSFADIRAVARRDGDDLVLRFSNDNRLRIEDIRLSELDRDDFLL